MGGRRDRVFFLADMHLIPADAAGRDARRTAEEENARLGRFLDWAAGQTSAIVLLGDTFNFWFERGGRFVGNYEPALALFRRAADADVDIHHVSGNRDYAVGEGLGLEPGSRYRGFLRMERGFTVSRLADFGIEPHGPRYRFHHQGKTVSCLHGDALCRGDRLFMLLRWILQGPVGRRSMRLLPFRLLSWLIRGWQEQEKRACRPGGRDPGDRLDRKAAEREIALGSDLVVCGHIHSEHRRTIEATGRKGRLVAIPSWQDGCYGVLENGDVRVETFA